MTNTTLIVGFHNDLSAHTVMKVSPVITLAPPSPQLSLKCRAPEVSQYVYQMYDSVLKN